MYPIPPKTKKPAAKSPANVTRAVMIFWIKFWIFERSPEAANAVEVLKNVNINSPRRIGCDA